MIRPATQTCRHRMASCPDDPIPARPARSSQDAATADGVPRPAKAARAKRGGGWVGRASAGRSWPGGAIRYSRTVRVDLRERANAVSAVRADLFSQPG